MRKVDLPGGTVELADGHQTPAQQVQGGARTINSVPEVKWEPRHQRLNGNSVPEFKWEKNGHQSCLPVRVFAIFFDVSRCKRYSAMSRNMYIFYPGDSLIKGTGMLMGNFEKPLKKTNLGVGQPFFFLPLKDTILLQCSFVIDVIENFDYMN